ncbi:MAG: restriction endonuclease subunit S [Haliea sp.]|nr:restriction endonuclease subunit S [Haliea sp.]
MSPAAEEVAGVPDELTAGWKIRQIQEVAEVNPRIDKRAIPDDIQVSFVPMPAVQAESGEIDVSQTKLAKEVKKGFTAFLQGDVLFAKITPCMENGKMAIAPTLVNGYGFGSTEFHVLRPREGLDAKYLYYYVSSKSFRDEAEGFMTGAVGQKRVSTTYIKEATIPVAPLEDQRRIVAEIENSSPASTKPSPASSVSKPTSSATKLPSSRPPSKASSQKNGANKTPTSNQPVNSLNASSPNAAGNGKKPSSPR